MWGHSHTWWRSEHLGVSNSRLTVWYLVWLRGINFAFYPNSHLKRLPCFHHTFPLSSQYKNTPYYPSFDIIVHYRSSFIFCLSFNTLRNIKIVACNGLGVHKCSFVWLRVCTQETFRTSPSHIWECPPLPWDITSIHLNDYL